VDDAFGHVANCEKANQCATQWDCAWLRQKLDDWAQRHCPVVATHRYLKFLLNVETPEVRAQALNRLTQPLVEGRYHYMSFNLLAEEDASVFSLVLHGEFAISGLTNKALRQCLPGQTSAQASRLLKRLRIFQVKSLLSLQESNW
jgi:hypothetical protein